MKTLLLYALYTDQLSYYDDWIDAFKCSKTFVTTLVNLCDLSMDEPQLHRNILDAEFIILHHSMTSDTLKYLQPLISILQQRKGKLISFVGNEVNLPILGMSLKIQILQQLETDLIITQLIQDAGDWLYADCKAEVLSLPHALNPKKFTPTIDLTRRSIDLGTRSSHYGAFIGDNDRNEIIEYFDHNADALSLTVDLGFNKYSKQRFNRAEWCDFLNQCKATLSTEAGSFYLERDDSIIKKMMDDIAQQDKRYLVPESGILVSIYRKFFNQSIKNFIRRSLGSLIIDRHKVLDELHFDQVKDKYFTTANRCPVYSKAISSRHFDAIGTKTLHVMYPGRYNDILSPGINYFELQRDHSNINELLELLRDADSIRRITDTTYDYIMALHTHEMRLNTLAAYLMQRSDKK